jgi:RNA polymerase sigma-70 factor (ECF subfamily)
MGQMVGDEDLELERARQGDQEAFRILVVRHSRAVFRLAYRLTGNEQDAEDVVQETFLKAYRQLAGFESRSRFSSWVHRIAANCAYDCLRRRMRQREDPQEEEPVALSEAPSAERIVFSAEVRGRLKSAMARLSPSERSAFLLRHHEGLSIDEIGDALGLERSAAKQSIFRAVRKMRAALHGLVEVTS